MARMKEENPASIAQADQRSIASFIERVWSEDGLSDRTLEAYRRDLEGLARWLATRGRTLETARREDLSAYHGAAPVAVRSLARRQSSFRRYYGFLARHSADFEDPTRLIDRP